MRSFFSRVSLRCFVASNEQPVSHYPVLYKPLLKLMQSYFSTNEPFLALDCTLGGAGHSEKILSTFPHSRLVGLDIDPEMIPLAQTKLEPFILKKRAAIFHKNYATFSSVDFEDLLNLEGFPEDKQKFDFILADLGLNSYQLSSSERGFSYKLEGELDMRYDRTRNDTSTCADIVNTTREFELAEIFKKFGGEPSAKHLSKEIIRARKGRIIKTTKELNNIIWNAFGSTSAAQRYKIVTRAFQALRIAVNYELMNLIRFMDDVIENLEENGMLAIISFHSGEDDIVKDYMHQWVRAQLGALLTKTPILPKEEELRENSRSHSAKMRVFVKKSD